MMDPIRKEHQVKFQHSLLALVVITLAACAIKPVAPVLPLISLTSTASSTASSKGQIVVSKVTPSPTPILPPKSTFTPYPGVNIPAPSTTYVPPVVDITIQQAITATNWATYVFSNSVSVDYPVDWTVEPSEIDYVIFKPPADSTINPIYGVMLNVYSRPFSDRRIADPHTWGPNEGGYEVQWEKPISIRDAEGFEFVWAAPQERQWEYLTGLTAIYYSEQYNLDVRLTTSFEVWTLETVKSPDFGNLVSSKLSIFEHMVQSIRFVLAG